MTFLDILIIIGLSLFMLLGFRDGLFKKIFGIFSFWGGLVLATIFMNDFGIIIGNWLDIPSDVANILSFFLIFLSIIIGQIFFYKWIGKTASESIKFWSRIGGSALGIFQGAIVISLILVFLNIFDIPSAETKKESLLYSPLYQFAPIVFNKSTTWIPESKEFFKIFEEHFENLKKPI